MSRIIRSTTATFEGTIPEGRVWRRHRDAVGHAAPGSRRTARRRGGAEEGQAHLRPPRRAAARENGRWCACASASKNDKDNWLLIKERDEYVRRDGTPIIERETTSVASPAAPWMRSLPARRSGIQQPGERRKPAIRSFWPRPRRPKAEADGAQNKTPRKRLTRKLPAFVEPQLATLVDAPPAGDDWLHEIKYDGYRAIAAVAGGKVVMLHPQRARLDRQVSARWCRPLSRPAVRQRAARRRDRGRRRAKATPISARCRTRWANGRGGIGYYLFDLL